MGSGKTTVGRKVAAAMGLPFVDNDEQLAIVTGTDAATLAATRGLDHLHDVEAAILLDALTSTERSVVAAASSTIEHDECRRALQQRATTVWLHDTAVDLAGRASDSSHRPRRPGDLDAVAALSAQRDPLYAAVADLDVDVSRHDAESAAQLIVTNLESLA